MRETPVTFECRNQQIVGIIHLPNKKNPPTVIMCHGWGGNKLGTWTGLFVKTARKFCNNGFAVLRFDFRGSGDSQGDFEKQTNETLLEDLDCLMNSIDSDVGLIGHSLGGKISILKASMDKRVKCLASWASPVYKDFFTRSFLEEIEQRKNFYFNDIGYSVSKRQIDSYLRYDTLKALKKVKIPFLIVNGSEDTSVYPSQARKLYKNARRPKKLAIIHGANHYFLSKEKELIKVTLDWFKKYLKK
jgi:pimeloyl-ACP methyl ester carboxylesterase